MLSIGKLARGQADDYLEQAKGRVDHATSVETGAEDYYPDHGLGESLFSASSTSARAEALAATFSCWISR